MSRKKKQYDDDDGRTIVDMNVDGMPWYQPKSNKKVSDEDKPSRKELFAMIRAGFRAYFPTFLAILVGISVTFLLIYCWLNGWFINR